MKAEVGTILKVTRRHVDLCSADFEVISGKVGVRGLDICVGDSVSYTMAHGECIIEELLPRKNCIVRSYDAKRKKLASNVDRMFVVSAVPPLFNSHSIDRMLVVAAEQQVDTTLIINKVDLIDAFEEVRASINYYESLGIDLLRISAKRGDNMDQVIQRISDPGVRTALLCGVSGVGKSSILNALVPEAFARTKETSRKTGQGRQVTSGAVAYIYQSEGKKTFLIDLPGLQNYGVSHLTEDDVRRGFSEIWKSGQQCEFSNCSHIKEDNCVVLERVHEGQIAAFRYLSYLSMVEEIRASKPY